MPYYKGVHFDQAFHTEEDLHAYNGVTSGGSPVAAVPPAPVSEPDFAVPVDRPTPILKSPVVDVQSDPFPADLDDPFPAAKMDPEPETQPESESTDSTEGAMTPAETPDGKKKKKSAKH